jgi:ferrous iron transport protein B
VAINPRKNTGIVQLKKLISQVGSNLYKTPVNDFIDMEALAAPSVGLIKEKYGLKSKYLAWHYLLQPESFFKDRESQEFYTGLQEKYPFNKTKIQAEEILQRYRKIKLVMRLSVVEEDPLKKSLFTQKLDNLLLHRVWGYLILLVVLFLLFQSMFWFARYPMSLVETGFAQLSGFLSRSLPVNYLSDLLVNGLLAGLSGILVFVPQIMILFGLITLLEDTGYMARISFLSDRLMRTAGLNGKSVVPMISGFACAVPAIMSARNIENKKERLLTILITPLMSCSARLPVYSVLIALVIPDKFVAGIFNIQGLVMLGLYLLGLILAMGISWFFSKLIKIKEKSFFLLELPIYRAPRWGNIASTMILKARIFVMQAGKVIMMISMVLWILSSFGPGKSMSKISEKYSRLYQQQPGLKDSLKKLESAEKLENSFAGILGKTIEPAIRPLGYDWKIGIALICSFAAREVFVGTMATLYSVGEGEKDSEKKLTEKMKQAKFENGKPVYTLASGVGLMIFYALAMQCMSTLAVVKRETKSWKWPVIQFCYMTVLAYVFSWLAYIILK